MQQGKELARAWKAWQRGSAMPAAAAASGSTSAAGCLLALPAIWRRGPVLGTLGRRIGRRPHPATRLGAVGTCALRRACSRLFAPRSQAPN